jgi:hypothetical protein
MIPDVSGDAACALGGANRRVGSGCLARCIWVIVKRQHAADSEFVRREDMVPGANRLVTLVMLAATVGVSAAAQPPARRGWQLVYAVDSTGQVLQGDKATLLRAVRAGQPVRVGWRIAWRLPDGTAGALEHVADAAFLTIHHDEVFAQMAPILGQRPSAREPIVTFRSDGDQLWYALLDTTGRLVGYFAGGESPQTTRTPTSWYVDLEPGDA